MTLTGNWSYPTSVRFGAGRISEIGGACMAAGITYPLLVTDRGLAGMEITRQTLDLLEAEGFGRGMFSDVDPNPSDLNVSEGLRVYRAGEDLDHEETSQWTAVSRDLDLDSIVDYLILAIPRSDGGRLDELRYGTSWRSVVPLRATNKGATL